MIENSFFGTDGQPYTNNYGYVKLVYQYDDQGNRIKTEYLGLDEKLHNCHEGLAVLEKAYDIHNNLTKVVSYDNLRQKCINRYGFCSMIMDYDERGNCIETKFLGINDEPVESDGYYRSVSKYDDHNRQTSVINYNKENKEIANQISTEIADLVYGVVALQAGLPLESILLQWNDWRIGDAIDALSLEQDRSRYGKKNVYYITPEGEIKHLYIERGLIDISHLSHNVEKPQTEEWLKKLEQYKKEHGEK